MAETSVKERPAGIPPVDQQTLLGGTSLLSGLDGKATPTTFKSDIGGGDSAG